MYYDAPGRLIRTEFPDGTFSRVEFSPWLSRSFDPNDTVLGAAATAGTPSTRPQPRRRRRRQPRAPRLAARCTPTRPAETHFDSLGRDVIAIAHNRTPDEPGPATATVAEWRWKDERYLTFTKLDAEGKPLWICDARGNLVMQYITPPKPDHTPLYDT